MMKEKELEEFLLIYFQKIGINVKNQVQIEDKFRADIVIYKESQIKTVFEIKGDPLIT